MGKKTKKTPSPSSSEPTAPDTQATLTKHQLDGLEQRATTAAANAPADVLIQHGLAVTEYARKIVSGEIIACMWVRRAAERHLKDLDRSKHPKYPYRFDLNRGGAICYFLELCPHIDGNWGSETIVLELWQKFIWGSVFGWVRKKDALRRFLEAYVSVPRKNAKTTMLAGVNLYGLTCDNEPGAQIYNGANKLEQAMLLFEPARLMVEKRPEIFKRLGVEVRGAKCLFVKKTNSRWRPVSRKPGDGGGAHFFTQDEYHEATSAALTEAMVQGQGARKQPLAVFITTSGTNLAGPCYSYEQQIKQILQGLISRERTFGIIYTIDEEPYTDPFGVEHPADDWTSIDAAKKANPNWGVSVIEDTYLAKLEEAIQDPAKTAMFKTKRLNIWMNAAKGYFNLQRWAECKDESLQPALFHGEPCLDGVDLAAKIDLCARALLFRRDPEGPKDADGNGPLEHYYVFWRWYLPSAVANLTENSHYAEWKARWLTVTEGDITDYRFILRDMIEDTKRFNVLELDFDQREAGKLSQDYQEETGIDIFEVPQQTKVLSEPLKWLQALIVDRRIHHCGDPIGTWCVSNVEVIPDQNENVFPRHPDGDQKRKIDGVSALLNALVRARELLSQPAPGELTVEVWS
jgi:phage terminase large subunit-like protein